MIGADRAVYCGGMRPGSWSTPMSPPLSARILCIGFGAALVIALAFAAIDTQAQAPAVLAATSTAAAHTAEAAYATAVARNASSPNGTPSSPAPLGSVAIAPTPVYAAATQTVAARTAEAGIVMVETSVAGYTPTPVPPVASLAAPASSTPLLLPSTGHGDGETWPTVAVLIGTLVLIIGLTLHRRRSIQ
jgi:LPXTG-motif cell wall-anchored protein